MELQILHWFESLHNPILNPIMYGFTCLGNYGAVWILLAFLLLLVFPKKYKKLGAGMAIALILSFIFCDLITKNVVQRVRPFNADQTFENLYGVFTSIHDWSFPSGHTTSSLASAIAVFMWDKKKGTVAVVFAVLIAVSRLYLTVHYPTDVLTGAIFGTLCGVLSYFIVKALMKKFPRVKTFLE